MVIARLGEAEWGHYYNGYRVSILQDEKNLEMDGGNFYKIMNALLIPLNCTLKYS